jgi:ubiquinone/menaquinone biosynthesis C-methylase UbiE
VAPFSHALWRAVEAGEVSKLKYDKPVLDIGCGFGEFAGVFFESTVEVGIDISSADLIKAKTGGKYRRLFLADARSLPFEDKSFSTVISISVLEHIPKVELALREISRVLKKGGVLIFTVPTDRLYDSLFYTQLFEKIEIPILAKLYFNLFNNVFKHYNIFSQERWGKMVEKAGLKVEKSQIITSKTLTMLFDLFLIYALPSQIGRLFFRKRFIWALKTKTWFLKRIFSRYLLAEAHSGSNIIIMARKNF